MLSQFTTATSALENTEMDIVSLWLVEGGNVQQKKLGETVNEKLNYDMSYLPLDFTDVNKVSYCASPRMEYFHIA